MYTFFPTIAFMPDLLFGAVGFLATIVISFFSITLIASYYRFERIIKEAEDVNPEDMGVLSVDILRVQFARYLAQCTRNNSSLSVSLIKFPDVFGQIRLESPVVLLIKKLIREEDTICVYDENTLVLLQEQEPEDIQTICSRIVDALIVDFTDLSADLIRVGSSFFPDYGSSGMSLFEAAKQELEKTTAEKPIVVSEIVKNNLDDEEDMEDFEDIEEEDILLMRRQRKGGALDELTGVLKPSAISSYMQRKMSDLRYKKKNAALFCIGVNNMEYIENFHGSAVADDILAKVSKLLQKDFRVTDMIGRHEEYAFLVLADASLEQASIIGHRISLLAKKNPIKSDNKALKVTFTIGVAVYPEHGRNLHNLYKSAQKVLDYSRTNDIRAYAVYNPKIHASIPSKPMRSIKSLQA